MDRKEFLQICQRVSMLPETTMHIKMAILPELIVLFEGIQFYPIGYEMTFKDGNPQHIAILHDMKAHSIIKVNLERIENYENSN